MKNDTTRTYPQLVLNNHWESCWDEMIGHAVEAFSLTRREITVLSLIMDGLTNPDIAKELFISRATVRNHCINAYYKLGVNDRVSAAVRFAECLTLVLVGRSHGIYQIRVSVAKMRGEAV